ncbi:1-acyl-sn-glycerol-3-phosphate acyltransferase [Candidatus Giovannonibacteria bacterium]|nr:1-acyl-sn-glycerol-3-phosphate acyltransferase [Candidatus Giovannonibacteria bacterium]
MKYWYWFIQNLMRPAVWILILVFYRVEIRGRENFEKISPPLIIVSNHKTLFDGFLILIALPWFSRFLPGRYMTEEMRFKGRALQFLADVKLLKFFYILTGGFPSKRGLGAETAIQIPLKILEKGGVVLMFPEGRLVREDNLGVFYNGTVVLVTKSGAPVLPFFIKIERRKIIITIGESFKLNTSNFEEEAAFLKAKIENLRPS